MADPGNFDFSRLLESEEESPNRNIQTPNNNHRNETSSAAPYLNPESVDFLNHHANSTQSAQSFHDLQSQIYPPNRFNGHVDSQSLHHQIYPPNHFDGQHHHHVVDPQAQFYSQQQINQQQQHHVVDPQPPAVTNPSRATTTTHPDDAEINKKKTGQQMKANWPNNFYVSCSQAAGASTSQPISDRDADKKKRKSEADKRYWENKKLKQEEMETENKKLRDKNRILKLRERSTERLRAEMQEISEEQQRIREGQRQIRKKLEQIESECKQPYYQPLIIRPRVRSNRERLRTRFHSLLPKLGKSSEQLPRETEAIVQQNSGRNKLRLALMFRILKARESGDYHLATLLAQHLRSLINEDHKNDKGDKKGKGDKGDGR